MSMVRSLEGLTTLEEDLQEIGLSEVEEINTPSEADADLSEDKFRRTPKKTKSQKTTSSQRRKWKLAKRRPKAKAQARKRLRKPLTKRRAKMREKFKAKRKIPKRPPGRGGRVIYRMYQGMDRVSNLVEEVADLVGSLDEASQTEIIKAYANSAVVAEMLGERFLIMAHAISEDAESDEDLQIAAELADLSEAFDSIAEDAAESAEVLFEMHEEGSLSESMDTDAVEENFKEVMQAVLEGLEIYTDLTEDEVEEATDPLGKISASRRDEGRAGPPDSSDRMGKPKMGKFPPRGPATPKVNQT